MIRYDAGTTNPTLLNRLGDWRDHEAWVDFVTHYDPVIRSISGRYRLDAESTEELCQRVWIDLARRMRTYRYDPGEEVSRLAPLVVPVAGDRFAAKEEGRRGRVARRRAGRAARGGRVR